MLASELITDEIPPLKASDSGTLALDWMDEYKVNHLPIVENNQFLGMVAEADLLGMDNPIDPVSTCANCYILTSVNEYQHIFEVVKRVADFQLSVIPVVNPDNLYIGCITVTKLMHVIADMPVVGNPGGIIVFEMNIRDYSLSEMARLVENDDAKILGAFITSHPDSTKMQVTLKINKPDLSAILQTFERYDYTVTASYDQGERTEDLKSRYDMLMNYLNM